ncbi:MAG: DUF2723 domain-containing protein [Candidatus Hydrogenedentes bacterium]|nr:DUF2723 domain-containing protein [Candidatus Hydrogenedentota bacterium]
MYNATAKPFRTLTKIYAPWPSTPEDLLVISSLADIPNKGTKSASGLLMPPTRGDYVTALSVGFFALLLYVGGLAPTVTGEDSGELIGAAYSLGVPHPPGYPVWTLLAHLFTWIPFGSIAWRVNAFSAVCGAGTVSLLTLIGIGLTKRRGAAALGALCFATSRAFWEQSVIAEVYTLSTLFMALLLYLCLRGFSEEHPARLYGTALLIGIGTGVHSTLVLLLPFWLLLLVLQSPPRLRRSPAFYLKAGFMTLLGCGVYAYLPLASLQDPAVDWGDPETLSRWWDVVRRAQYAFMVDQYPHSWERFLEQCATMARFWFRDFVGLGALLGLAGFGVLFRRRPYLALYLIAMALATVLAAVLMQNFEQDREWLWVRLVFLLPAELITAIGIICGFAWLGERWRNVRVFLLGIGVALLCASLLLHASASKSRYRYAEDYARNILASLPENSVYVPIADHQAFPLLYLHVVEGLRPDVTLLRKYGYLDLEAVDGLAEAGMESWGRFPKRRFDPKIVNWILENTDRPLFLHPQEIVGRIKAKVVPTGLLLQALRQGETAHVTPLPELSWRTPLPAKPASDYSLSLIQYDWASAKARMAFASGDGDAALAHVEEAVTFGHRAPVILHNMGVLCARNKAYDAAAGYFAELVEQQPDNLAAKKKLKRALRLRD